MNEDLAVLIAGFPLGPSVNECYRSVHLLGRTKTKVYRDFEAEAAVWFQKNPATLAAVKHLVSKVGPGVGLEAHYVFNFKPERLLMKRPSNPKHAVRKVKKAGESKAIDVGNYLKAAEDVICAFIEVDDCYFWNVTLQKVANPKREGLDLSIRLIEVPVA